MKEIYNVFWENLEHRIIVDRSKIDFDRLVKDERYILNDLNGVYGGENLPKIILVTIIYGVQYPGLKYEREN